MRPVLRFADCEVDVAARELRRAGVPVHLEPQAFDLLVLLIERRDRVLTNHELLDGVWGHRFLSEANITTRIKEIRRAVGDDGRTQHTVRNVRGRGYRFVAAVTVAPFAQPAVAEGDAEVGLLGRSDAIAAVLARLGGSRLVTIVGPGGVGKSSLAQAAVRGIVTGVPSPGDVVMIELSTLDRGDAVLQTVARELGVVMERERSRHVVELIARRPVLLVLDNCEHLVDAVAELVDQLLGAPLGSIRVLATSQLRLGVTDEVVVALEPLAPEPAAALFVRRAVAVGADAAGLDEADPRVLRLVDHLDRLPLAIEMAAARLGSMTLDELESAIVMEGRLVQVTHRTPHRRHRSLRSLVEWSTGLLGAEERRAFTECAAFAGWFGVDDAAAVLSASAGAGMVLSDLVERSLLSVDRSTGRSRYRMLETLKVVAAEELDRAASGVDVRRRHAEHVRARLEAADVMIRSGAEREGRDIVDHLVPELRHAFRWATDHQPASAAAMCVRLHLVAYATFWDEPVRWAEELLAAHPDLSPAAAAGAHVLLAGGAANRGDLEVAAAHATLARAAGDPLVAAVALEVQTDLALYSGHLSSLAELTEQLVVEGRGLDDPHLVVMATVNRALGASYAGDPVAARAALAAVDQDGLAPSDVAWLQFATAEALAVDRVTDALVEYRRALRTASGVGNPFVESVAQLALATESVRVGHLDDGLREFEQCLTGYLRHGNLVHAVSAVRLVIGVLVELGEVVGAAELHGAVTRDELRPTYGYDAAQAEATEARIVQLLGADEFDACRRRGAALSVDAALARAVDLVAAARRSL